MYGLYVQDQWTMHRMTLNLGVRYDQYWAWVPDTDIPAGRFGAARHYDQTDNLVSFKDINPRVGVAYDLFGNGKTAVKGFVGRYVVGRGAGVGNANPASAIVLSATRTWTDSNGNFVPDCVLSNLALNGECGLANNLQFGNAAARNITVDHDVNFGLAKSRLYLAELGVVRARVAPGCRHGRGVFPHLVRNQTYQDNTLVTGPTSTSSASRRRWIRGCRAAAATRSAGCTTSRRRNSGRFRTCRASRAGSALVCSTASTSI